MQVNHLSTVSAHDLSFCTSFIVAILFLNVKASRPMTYKYLTVTMIRSVDIKGGVIDQTIFKTNEKYGFDSLMFKEEILTIINSYIDHVRIRLNPVCDYLLVCRSGKRLRQLSDVFGRIVFQAISKYINPTRYRQIIETASAEKLDITEHRMVSEDQKHTSRVAKVHYKKMQSRTVAENGRKCMEKLLDGVSSNESLKQISKFVVNSTPDLKENSVDADSDDSNTHSSVSIPIRKKKMNFSEEEDNFLLKGIRKYGVGRWTSILNDSNYAFHPTRKACTLLNRAKNKGYIS